MVPQGNYYGDFDYSKAYGDNPFLESSSLVSDLVNRLKDSAFQSFGASGSDASSTVNSAPKPDDPDVQDYMEHILGGQRKSLDDYVAQAAGAGIKRGGLNVVGGPALESSLHQAAMKSLAAGYADRFREAMSAAKSSREANYSQYKDAIQNLESALGLQKSFLTSQSDWQNRLGDTMHGDWRSDVDWNRDTPSRELELEAARSRLENERLQSVWEAADRGRALQEQEEMEAKWTQLADKMGVASQVGQYGAGWTGADDMWAERLGVMMGYLKPWDRNLTVKAT